MKHTEFSPGFRLSVTDVFVAVGGTAAAIILSMHVGWWGFIGFFVLAHFFLFCNVVRMARALELVWAGVFLVLACSTIILETPSWLVTALVSLFVTAIVVLHEMRKPSYHGVGWQWINPGLPSWWAARIAEKNDG